jgi:hypothetical protein
LGLFDEQIWLASSGALVCSFSQKTYKRDLMQFTADEKLCFRSVTNEVGNRCCDDIVFPELLIVAHFVAPSTFLRYICGRAVISYYATSFYFLHNDI